jgi:hypothetical protein
VTTPCNLEDSQAFSERSFFEAESHELSRHMSLRKPIEDPRQACPLYRNIFDEWLRGLPSETVSRNVPGTMVNRLIAELFRIACGRVSA